MYGNVFKSLYCYDNYGSRSLAVFRIENRVESATGMIWTESGSGVRIENDHHSWIVTVSHLFHRGVGKIIVSKDGMKIPARLAGLDSSQDIALLESVFPEDAPVFHLSKNRAGKEDVVYCCGYGADGILTVRTASVEDYVVTDRDSDRVALKTTGRSREGDSGGAVLDSRGRLLGVLWGTDEWYSYSTPVESIGQFVVHTRELSHAD